MSINVNMLPAPLKVNKPMDLSKKLSSSNTIKSFLNFIQQEIYPNEPELKIIFVSFLQQENNQNTLNTVFWEFTKDFYISLSGIILKQTSNEDFQVLNTKILEENSSKNLLKLFTSETMTAGNEPLKNLIESMIRLAQVNIENHHETIDYEIYFQNSVIIGAKKEFPLFILKEKKSDIPVITADFITKLKESIEIEAKVEVVQDFYKSHPNLEAAELETILFSQVYELLHDSSNTLDFEKMVKLLREEGLELSDLTDLIKDFPVDLAILEQTFTELLESKEPIMKLKKLSELQLKIAADNYEINADLLLPLLTLVIVKLERGHLIVGEVEFIERYAHDQSLSGLNGYILTGTNAAIEVVKTIYKTKLQKDHPIPQTPSSPSHFSNLITSIGQMPKVIASSITSTLSRSRTSSAQSELEAFRERMLGTNSANDLQIRDINPLLEDYKNLLYILFKQ